MHEKLKRAVEAIRQDPTLVEDEARLAQKLGLLRPASARLWKVQAVQVLEQEARGTNGSEQ